MKRFQLMLPTEIYNYLKNISRERDVSIGMVIRDAINAYLAGKK